MQFSVHLKEESTPKHKCSRTLANHAVNLGLARKIGQNAIQLIRAHSWKDAKTEINRTLTGTHILNSPGYHTPAYTYPLSYEFLRTYQR